MIGRRRVPSAKDSNLIVIVVVVVAILAIAYVVLEVTP